MRRLGLLGSGVLSLFGATLALAQGREALELNERGLEAVKRGDQAEAEKLYRQAIGMWRQMGSDYNAHLGSTEYNLGQTLCALGRRGEALPVLEEALGLLRGSLGVRHLYTLSTMNYLATLHLMRGDAAPAEKLFREALPVERELFPRDTQLSLTLGGLSAILVRENRGAEALPMAEESLSLALSVTGEKSLEAALAYANVASVHKAAGRYDRALPLYRKSMSIYEHLVGPDHPRVAGILTEIGLIEMESRNYTLAERDMLRSLQITQRFPGWNFEEWIAESNLGMLRFRQGKYEEAARRLDRSLQLQEEAGVRGGLDMAVTIETLAKVREKQRRFDDAKQLRDRAAMASSFR